MSRFLARERRSGCAASGTWSACRSLGAMSARDEWGARAIGLLEEGEKRSGVVEKLAQQRCAVSAGDISEKLRADGRNVGRATVYRTLERLRELNLVQRLELGTRSTRYGPARTKHHHLVCKRCGEVVPFEDPRAGTSHRSGCRQAELRRGGPRRHPPRRLRPLRRLTARGGPQVGSSRR
jgi:Fur family transcriptional regulator, ferric uptake regulator